MSNPPSPHEPRRPARIPPTLFLLLNLAILLSNFAVSWGASETQTRVLRSTARLFHGVPRPGLQYAGAADSAVHPPGPGTNPPAGEPTLATGPLRGVTAGTRVRLARYLVRLPELERLSPAQVGALYRGVESTARALHEVGERLGARPGDGGRVRELMLAADHRMRSELTRSLRGVAIPDGPVLDRLVRIVVASAG